MARRRLCITFKVNAMIERDDCVVINFSDLSLENWTALTVQLE